MTTPSITFVVPTWNAGAFVGETLESIRGQTMPDFEVLVSVDPSPDDTVEVCQAVAHGDSRFRVLEHDERAGWVGNSNRAFDAVETDYFLFMPHDDLIEPTYLSALVAGLERHPDAVSLYPDMERFENVTGAVAPIDSLIGSTFERAAAWLAAPLGAIPWKGLTHRSVLDSGVRLIEGTEDGMHADNLWVLELALRGDCIRVPEAMYHKRVRTGSVVRGWEQLPIERRRQGWVFHLAEVAAALSRSELSAGEQEQLLVLAIGRMDHMPHRWRPASTPEETHAFIAELALEMNSRQALRSPYET